MGQLIEVFTDSGLFGNKIIERVQELACPKCTIVVYDACENNPETRAAMQSKIDEYRIIAIPAVCMGGKSVEPAKLDASRR